MSRVLSSIRDRGSAYVTFDRHREGDWKPYVYRTEDYGKTWVPLTRGLPSGSVNVIAEHPDNPDVLFLGTEHAVYLSVNAGSDWTKFKSNLPTTLYDDLLIHPREKDLVLGTHGRSFWVLDDTSPLAEWSTVYNKPVHVFSVRAATLFHYWKDTSYRAQEEWAGENPPYGAIISYLVNSDVDSVTITVKRRKNQIIRTYRQPVVRGSIQRLAWDLKYPPPSSQQNESKTEGLQKPKPEDILPKPAHPLDPQGPSVSPGLYSVTIAAGNETSTQPIRVNPDPKLNLKVGDYRQQEKFLVKLMVIYENAYAMNENLKIKIKELEEILDKDDEKLINVKDQQKQVNTIRTGATRLASELKGGGVRQGSFFPPTKTHLDRLLRLQALWDNVYSAD